MNEIPPRGAPGERPRRDLPEAGIDISGHTTNHVNDYLGQPFDPVVTVCDDARERCPVLPGAKRLLHRSFSDRPRPRAATISHLHICTLSGMLLQ